MARVVDAFQLAIIINKAVADIFRHAAFSFLLIISVR